MAKKVVPGLYETLITLGLAPRKSSLTKMDFIGNANKNFRFDHRYRALTGTTRKELEEALDQGFPYLPAGCSIELDAVASDIVLQNVKQAVGATIGSVVDNAGSLSSSSSTNCPRLFVL